MLFAEEFRLGLAMTQMYNHAIRKAVPTGKKPVLTFTKK